MLVNEAMNDILPVLIKTMRWVLGILGGLGGLGSLLVLWLRGFFNSYMPSPQRALLGAKNFVNKAWRCVRPQPLSDERFHVVLSWLEGDGNGESTKTVEGAFRDIAGIHLSRSARIVKASGARDDWEPAMRKRAHKILADKQAHLAIIGQVRDPRKLLNLWFVRREGGDTLYRGDIGSKYELKNMSLEDKFREEIQTEIAAMALSAVVPLVSDEAHGKILNDELIKVTKQINTLLETLLKKDSSPIVDPAERERRASLHMALGTALATLGERESGTERLEQAVAAYNAALEEFTRKSEPLKWAATQNNLGSALLTLGKQESSTERLERAVDIYKAVLEEFTRERVPPDWAMTQNNLGIVLRTLGERESGTERLEQAVAACNAALEVRTRERVPLDWAMTQNNLGNALAVLGERESGIKRLEEAVAAYNAALEVFTPDQTPQYWKTAQDNLRRALEALNKMNQ